MSEKTKKTKEGTSLGTKLFTAIFSGLLVVLMIASFIMLALIPDFVSPGKNAQLNADELIWYCNMDDLFDYFEEKGLMKKSERILMSPIGTENWICNNVDMIWWDVDNLAEGTEPYNYWQEYKENEYQYIIFGGAVYSPRSNGPFAVNVLPKYPGNTNDFYEAFMAFPKEWSKYETLKDRVPPEDMTEE